MRYCGPVPQSYRQNYEKFLYYQQRQKECEKQQKKNNSTQPAKATQKSKPQLSPPAKGQSCKAGRGLDGVVEKSPQFPQNNSLCAPPDVISVKTEIQHNSEKVHRTSSLGARPISFLPKAGKNPRNPRNQRLINFCALEPLRFSVKKICVNSCHLWLFYFF